MKYKIPLILIVFGTICFRYSLSSADASFKWIDADGHVHYGDTIPQENRIKKHNTINKSGVITNTLNKKKSLTERKKIDSQKKLALESKIIDRERALHIRALLDTFGSVEDIIMARDRKIALGEAEINFSKRNLESLQTEHKNLKKHAASRERSGLALPKTLYQKISQIQRNINLYQSNIRKKIEAQNTLKKKYEEDIILFKTIKKKAHGK